MQVSEIVASGNNGKCTIDTNQVFPQKIIYTPNEGYVGVDVCTYRACDSGNKCSEVGREAFVTISIIGTPSQSPTGTGPSAEDDVSTLVVENQDASVLIDVLENDSPAFGEELFVTSILSQASNGVCTIAQGVPLVIYTPEDNFEGTDQCEYEACDSNQACVSAKVTIVVSIGPLNTFKV